MKNVCAKLELTMVPIIDENVYLKDIIPDLQSVDSYSIKFFKLEKGELDLLYKPDKKNFKPDFKSMFYHEGVVVRVLDQEFSVKLKCEDKSTEKSDNIFRIMRRFFWVNCRKLMFKLT